jgi:hypothetical protein
MRNALLSSVTILAFLAAGAMAQSAASSPGTTGSSPAAQSPDQTSTAAGQNSGYGNSGNSSGAKAEKKLRGCVQSQNGQYVLQTKSGKDIPLTGQDVSAHVGHEVALHGSWAGSTSGSSDSMSGSANSGSSSGMAGGQANAFNVTSVDHISDTCGGKHSQSGDSTMPPK